jgi:hypothetical protein
MEPPFVVIVVLANPASSPAFVLGDFRESKLALGISDMGVDNGDSSAHMRHQIDKFAWLIQVIKEARAKNCIEYAIVPQIAGIITSECQIGQVGSRFDSLTIFEVAAPSFNAQHIEAGAREFDGIATLQASKIHNAFASSAIGKKHTQKLLRKLKQREIFHLPGLLWLRERSVVKPDVVRREAARHDLPLAHLTIAL